MLFCIIGNETNEAYPTNQSDALMSRRSFVKSAAAAAVLSTASPQALMAETKEEMPQRARGGLEKRSRPLAWADIISANRLMKRRA